MSALAAVAAASLAAGWFSGDATVGIGPAVTPNQTIVAPEAAVTFQFLPSRVKIALQVRAELLTGRYVGAAVAPNFNLSGGVSVRLVSTLFFRGLLGVFGSGACLNGDFCGGVGPTGSVELGASFPPHTPVRFAVIGRLNVSYGWVNRVDWLVAPSLNLGIAW